MADTWLSYSNQGATRSQPIAPDLVEAMSFLADMGIAMDVYSGGQPSAGNGPRVGSTRHDHGNSADVTFRKDGRQLDWNNESDLPVISDIIAQAKARGVTGIGAGDDYMGPGRFHVGFGEPSVWGAGGKSANAPEWLRNAYYGANPVPPRDIPNPGVTAPMVRAPIMRATAPVARQGIMRPAARPMPGRPMASPIMAALRPAGQPVAASRGVMSASSSSSGGSSSGTGNGAPRREGLDGALQSVFNREGARSYDPDTNRWR